MGITDFGGISDVFNIATMQMEEVTATLQLVQQQC